MGTVWQARDPVLARDVAIKQIKVPCLLTDEEAGIARERTLREARAAARLNHPAVVTVYDVVEADGNLWIVMELVRARSLEQTLASDGPLPVKRAAEVGAMVLAALGCAHAAGIMHRDVKPSNVLLGQDGRAVLTDFGIASLEGDPGLTQAGMVMGTPGFCAPERIRGAPASPASDLWSLGATLFAAVEGHSPFPRRSTPMAILAAVVTEEAPPTRRAGSLGPVIEALLRRDPARRPGAVAAARMLDAASRPSPAFDPEGAPGQGGQAEDLSPAAGFPAGTGHRPGSAHGAGSGHGAGNRLGADSAHGAGNRVGAGSGHRAGNGPAAGTGHRAANGPAAESSSARPFPAGPALPGWSGPVGQGRHASSRPAPGRRRRVAAGDAGPRSRAVTRSSAGRLPGLGRFPWLPWSGGWPWQARPGPHDAGRARSAR
jgi:hypothetical protein